MEYVVKVTQGDTYEEIARKHHTTVERLKRDNEIEYPMEGMRILIRKREKEYIVRPYDTLKSIAEAHNTTEEKLKELNGLEYVFLGQIIELP